MSLMGGYLLIAVVFAAGYGTRWLQNRRAARIQKRNHGIR